MYDHIADSSTKVIVPKLTVELVPSYTHTNYVVVISSTRTMILLLI